MKFENSNRVFILNKHGKPLMPCKPRKARLLLKANKAKIVNRYPFTIQLLYGSTGYTQDTKQFVLLKSADLKQKKEDDNF